MPRRKQLRMRTPGEVRRALTRIANMVLNGELDPKEANSIILCCNAILGAIRTDEQARKLDELEKMILEQQKKR